MTIRLIQGFDMFAATNNPTVPFLNDAEAGNLLGFRPPFNNDPATWFINSAAANEGLTIDATLFRINGKSLRIDRNYEGATYNPQFNGIKHLDFTKTFVQSDRACIGFAMRMDVAPSSDIPLIQFFADVAGEQEQLSLWLTPTGRFYVGTNDFAVADDSTQANTAIAGASSATGAFRFARFVYLEADLNFTTAAPTFTLYVNGVAVISVTGSSFRKVPSDFLDGISIIVPHNQYWGATGQFSMHLDDVYVSTDEAPLGPQHIALLVPNATVQAEWSTTGGTADSILNDEFNPASLGTYVFNALATDHDIYGLTDAGAEIVSISAVAPTALMNIDSGSDVLKLSIRDSVSLTQRDATVAVDSPEIEFKQTIFTTNADTTAWTNTLLDQLQLALDLS